MVSEALRPIAAPSSCARDQLTLVPQEHTVPALGRRSVTVASHVQAVERAIRAMHQRLGEPISLHAMAEIAILSPYHFNRVFCQITGIPPGRFLAALRLEAAKRLLLTTDLRVTDICYEVGYNSVGTFTTHFTQQVGLSPGGLRNLAHRQPTSYLAALRDRPPTGPRGVAGGRYLAGQVTVAQQFSGLICVGLFSTRLPQGRPRVCTLLTTPGSYRLGPLPDGPAHVFAIAMPWSSEPGAYLLPHRDSLWVGAVPDRSPAPGDHPSVSGDIVLRAVQPTDPPILVALPLLLSEQMNGVLH